MAIERYSEEFSRALAEGAWLLQTNQPQAAVDKLLPLYEQAPTNADVAINLGGAYILMAKWNKAVRVLSKAAELHADNSMVWSNLAAAHLGRLELSGPQQQERAIRAYKRALEIDPTAPNIHYHLGLIYRERGELTEAIRCFEEALVVNPADKDASFWIARLSTLLAKAEGQNSEGPDAPSTATEEVL
jgi:tetratricopeptide (TPR) repeat protein